MAPKRHLVTVTTDSDGNGTGYTSGVINGRVISVQYVKDGGSDAYADGVDVIVSGESTGAIVWDEDDVNASCIRHPKAASYLNTSGAAMLFAAGGTAVPADVVIAGERIKVAIASGGDTKTGTFYIVTE